MTAMPCVGRRGLLRGAGLAGLAATTLALLPRRPASAGTTLNVAGYGGALDKYLTRDFAGPFEKATASR